MNYFVITVGWVFSQHRYSSTYWVQYYGSCNCSICSTDSSTIEFRPGQWSCGNHRRSSTLVEVYLDCQPTLAVKAKQFSHYQIYLKYHKWDHRMVHLANQLLMDFRGGSLGLIVCPPFGGLLASYKLNTLCIRNKGTYRVIKFELCISKKGSM